MRSFKHINGRYIVNRLAIIVYSRRNPHHPWLTPIANKILESYLKKTDQMLEFGSGRSTLWFAERVGHLTSVEHNQEWYDKVKKSLDDRKFSNVDYFHADAGDGEAESFDEPYVVVADKFADASLDAVLVDGVCRGHCAIAVIDKIRPGGVLVIDNVNWFLPSNSISPNSRSAKQGPKGDIWRQFNSRVENWRVIWTSCGVTDTAFFIKPCL